MRTPGSIRRWGYAGAAVLGLSPSLAAAAEDAVRPYPACERTPTEGDTAAAKGAFQAGDGSFKEADYDRAIMYWEDAYRRDCTAHPLLLNLARAYELNGQKRHAAAALETFLARSPGSSDENQIKRRVEKLREQIQAEDGAAAAPGPAAPPPAAAQPVAAPPPGSGVAEPGQDAGHKRSIVPLVVVGAGGVITIVSVIVLVGAQSDISDFEKQCPNRKCPANITDDANAARSRSTLAGVFTGVGLAAVAGGLVWYFVSAPSQTASAPQRGFVARVAPAVDVGYGGLQLAGQF